MVAHLQLQRAPVAAVVLGEPLGREGFLQTIAAVVERDLVQAQIGLVHPHHLPRVAGIGVFGDAFEYVHCRAIQRLVAHPFEAIFADVLRAQVFVGKLAAHEGAGLTRAGDAFHAVDRGQVEPAPVIAVGVGVGQQRGAGHVAGLVENDQRAIAAVGALHGPRAQHPHRLVACRGTQHHGHAGLHVPIALALGVGPLGDGRSACNGGLFAQGFGERGAQPAGNHEQGRAAACPCQVSVTDHWGSVHNSPMLACRA